MAFCLEVECTNHLSYISLIYQLRYFLLPANADSKGRDLFVIQYFQDTPE